MSLLLPILFLLTILIFPLITVHASTGYCNRSCGSNNVNYPFGFSAGCKIRLNCSSNGQMLIGEFPIQSVNTENMKTIIEPKCNRSVQTLLQLYGKNFAPTARNAILLYDCDSSPMTCKIPSTNVQTQFQSLKCDSNSSNVISNISCYSEGPEKFQSGFLAYKNVTDQHCRYLMSSISAEAFNRSGTSLDVQVVELGWWIEGSCHCSKDANCDQFVSPHGRPVFRCRCKDGFEGDGFSAGSGCRKALLFPQFSLAFFINMTNPKDSSPASQGSNSQGSNDLLSNQGSDDPFFVHHSDNPTAILVSPMLSGDNYNTWLRSISRALRAKNKLGFVDGTITPPTDPVEKSKWSRCDDLVASWVLNSVTPEIRGSILYANSAHDIWKDLSDRFSQTNAPKIYQLKQSISSLKQDNTTVSAYYSLLKSLWDELTSLSTISACSCGHGHEAAARIQEDRAMEFLQGLHDRFSAIRSQILLMDPFPSIARIYSLVRQEEKQQEIHTLSNTIPEAAALNFQRQNYRQSQPHNSGKFGKEQASNQPFNSKPQGPTHRNGKPRPYCDHCKTVGHYRETCYKIHGYPPKNFHANAISAANAPHSAAPLTFTMDQYNKLLSMIDSSNIAPHANLTGPVIEEEDWTGTPT